MFFSTGMVTYLLVTSMLSPVLFNYNEPLLATGVDLLTPSLVSRIVRLERRLRWIPPVAFGAGILAYGSAIVGGRVFRNYVEWRSTNPPTYSHIEAGGWGGWAAADGSDFKGGAGGWNSWIHDLYERNSQRGTVRGHRTIDFLAFSLDKSRVRFRGRLEAAFKAAYEYLAAEPHVKVVGEGGWSSGPVVEVVHEKPIVVTPVRTYSHGGGHSYYEPHGDYSPKYYSSPEEAGHTHHSGGYGGGKVRSSRMSVAQSTNHFDIIANMPFIPMPAEPTRSHSGPITVRIKRGDNNNSTTAFKTRRIKSKTSTTPKPKPEVEYNGNIMGQLVEDIGTFFNIIGYFDENDCLQKFICNVHVRVKDLLLPNTKGKELSLFESNVASAFKVLDTFMPSSDQNYKNYRAAALLGSKSSSESCTIHYSSCKYSTADIIGFNNVLSEVNKPEKGNDNGASSSSSTSSPPQMKKSNNKSRQQQNKKSNHNSTLTTTIKPSS